MIFRYRSATRVFRRRSAEEPRLADPALVNAKLTRVKADGMQTPAAESCIQDDLVVPRNNNREVARC